MALIYSSTNNFWIKPNALNIGLNHLENPNLIEASLLAGAVIMAYKEGVIPFNAAHNYRTWQLNASRTFLEKDGKCYVYARLDRNESSNLAQIIYSYERRDMLGTTVNEDGTTDNVTDPAHYYILLGVLSAAIDDDGNSVPRVWEEGLYSGSLATDQYIQEEASGELKKMFRLNTVTNLIDVLLGISSATINVLTVAKTFILGGKTITGVADSFSTATPSDKDIATSAYIDANTLSSKSVDTAKGHITFEKGITVKESVNLDNQDITGVDVKSDVPDGGLTDAKDTSIPTSAAMVKHVQEYGDANYLSKVKDDTAKGKITFEKQQQFDEGFKVGNFNSGVADGTGGAMEVKEGVVTTTTDYLNVRRKARFNDVEILTTHHIGGAQMSSAARCKIDFVETVKSGDSVTGYRCYFRKNDADGRVITNDWVVGDQAYCNTFNLSKQADGTTGNHFFWRFVNYTGVNYSIVTGDDGVKYNGNEYYYIILSGPRCAEGSDAPQAGDEVVLLGHQPQSGETEADYAGRQSAIYQVASGTDGRPYYRQYVGINSFSLDGCLEQQFMPGDNIFSGQVIIKGGSGWENLKDKNGLTLGSKLDGITGIITSTSEPQFNSYEEAVKYTNYIWYNPTTNESKIWVNTSADDFKWMPYNDFSYKYLEEALRGSTAINGGLVLTNMLMLGKYTDDDTLTAENTTSGINGIVEDDNSVAVWGGGTLSEAQELVRFYKDNPKAQPTEEELAEMAKFVVTHGGKAILQNAIVSGTVHATNGSFINGTFKNVVINGAYNRLVQTVDNSNYNNFLFNDGDDNEYYALLLQWGDVIHLNLTSEDLETAPQIMLPTSIPFYNDIDKEVQYSNVLGYRTNDAGDIVPMDIDDLRSLVGRKIVIHVDNVRSDLCLNVGNIYMETSIPPNDDEQEFYLTSPEQGNWIQSPTDGQIYIGNGETFIMECLLAKRKFPIDPNDDTKGWTIAEMICWSVQKITMSSKQQAGDIIAFKVNCNGYPSTWRAEKGMTWEDFVDSSYSNEQFSIDSNNNVCFNDGDAWDLYHNYDEENETFTNNVNAREAINEGDIYYAG